MVKIYIVTSYKMINFFFKAMTQERRRYGFVLERQCSLVKHCLVYHTNTQLMYDEHLNDWLDVAKSRERLPESVETMFATKLRVSSNFPILHVIRTCVFNLVCYLYTCSCIHN